MYFFLIFNLLFIEEVMYDFLFKYLMSEDDLVENGYLRSCSLVLGKVVFKIRKE